MPTGGSYEFQGVHVELLSQRQRTLLRRHYLGFVFQGFNLLARTTALENVELPLIYRHEAAAKRHAAARAALDQVGLKGWEHHNPSELSGGQQQRSRSPAPSSPDRSCCWPTSQPATWIRAPAGRSWT